MNDSADLANKTLWKVSTVLGSSKLPWAQLRAIPFNIHTHPLRISFSEGVWLLQKFLRGCNVLFVFWRVWGEISKISAFFLGVSWKICFIDREVRRKEHNICAIHSYFSEGFLNITEFRNGYPNKTLHPYTFLKRPEKRVFLGFEVKNYLIHRGVWILNGMAVITWFRWVR